LWRVADALGEDWPGRIAASYAVQSSTEDDDDEPAQVLILRDVIAIFEQKRAVRLPPIEIVGELHLMEDRPWAEWKHGRPLTPHGLARLLKPFKVRTTVQKDAGRAARFYLLKDLVPASEPYTSSKGGGKSRNAATREENQEVTPFSDRNRSPDVTSASPPNPLKTLEGYAVTHSAPPLREGEGVDDPNDPEAWR